MDVLIISSSREEIDDYYKSVAKSISQYLAKNDCNLIFGASSNSMMGICYEEFQKNERNIYAFTTKKYTDDLKNLPAAKQYICNSTFEMKQRMFENADMIVCLPGGIGTFSELLSFLEEKRSNDKETPIIIYDENNYFKELMYLFDSSIVTKFTSESIYDYFDIAKNKIEFEDLFMNKSYELNSRKARR